MKDFRRLGRCWSDLAPHQVQNPNTGRRCVFLTINFKLSAKTIADVCKSRWQVEMFLTWIKQRLKVKSFVGASRNAVLTELWIAMCVNLSPSHFRPVSSSPTTSLGASTKSSASFS